LRRAEGGGLSSEVEEADGRRLFVKVYDRDSRDADLLYRGYRTALYRGPTSSGPVAHSTVMSSTRR
jgi:hypothetical protein